MSETIQKAFVVNGKIFATQAEATDYLRRPKILAALAKVTEGNDELSNWLLEQQERVEVAFETGTIRRVTKSEKSKMDAALDRLIELAGDDKKAKYAVENIGAIKDSFRWPAVKRMDAAEKATAARNTLVLAAEGNESLADWIVANKDAILAAYDAGVIKREVSPAASNGLQAYREEKAKQKKILEEQGQEALDKYLADKKKAEEAAKAAAKKEDAAE